MALTESCETYVGKELLVEPETGYGWSAQVAGSYPQVELPTPFHFVVERFFRFDNALMGGIGTVREPGHPLHTLRIGFSARHAIDRDFIIDPVLCNLTVGSETRTSQNGWLLAVGAPALVGFGRLRDDTV